MTQFVPEPHKAAKALRPCPTCQVRPRQKGQTYCGECAAKPRATVCLGCGARPRARHQAYCLDCNRFDVGAFARFIRELYATADDRQKQLIKNNYERFIEVQNGSII